MTKLQKEEVLTTAQSIQGPFPALLPSGELGLALIRNVDRDMQNRLMHARILIRPLGPVYGDRQTQLTKEFSDSRLLSTVLYRLMLWYRLPGPHPRLPAHLQDRGGDRTIVKEGT